MPSSIVLLKRILKVESEKKSKDMVMSLKVFKKLSSLLLTKADNTTIDVAVRMYRDAVTYRNENRGDAVKSKTKMTDFSATKTALKTKQNIEDYKAETQAEEGQFLNYDYDNKEREKKVYNKKHKSIIEVDSKISKLGRTQTIIAIEEAKGYLKRDLTKVMKKMSRVKFDSILQLHFLHHTIDDEGEESVEHSETFLTVYRAEQIMTEFDIVYVCKMYYTQFETALERLKLHGSGWSIKAISHHKTRIYENRKLTASKYIPSPAELQNAKCGLINIRNDDNLCFKWCMLYHQSKKEHHSERISVLKKIVDKYDYSNITFPAGLTDIEQFEINNKDVKITIFEYVKEEIRVFRQSKKIATDEIFLLRLDDGENNHYVYIKSMSNLFKTSVHNTKIFCNQCLKHFTTLQFEKHQCNIHEANGFKTIITYPSENEYMQMTIEKRKNQIEAPFIVCADFESFLIPCNDKGKFQKHVVNSYALQVVCSFDKTHNKFYSYRGENPVAHMIETLLLIKNKTDKIIKRLRVVHKSPKLTAEEECSFQASKICHICEEEIHGAKVRDHCHLTGKYRGSACNSCNLNFTTMSKDGKTESKPEDLKIIFHNLRGYDGHFIIQEASKYTLNVKVIKQSFEKFMTFSFCNLRFIDSFLFMSSSLDILTESLKTKNEDEFENFNFMKEAFGDNAPLMIKKGVYPYEFVSDESKFLIEGLPNINSFHSQLRGESINNEQYTYAKLVYETMNCKNFGDYHDLYLKCDVLLLTDIMQNFRKTSLTRLKLDPCNYLTTPSLSWDAMLNMTKVRLGLIHDEETRLIFENNKRGGIVQAGGRRLIHANNKYMKNYNPNEKSTFIQYLDMNNQYGKGMIDYLPYELIGKVEKNLDEILKHSREDEIGFFVECDIECPNELHKKFRDYPLCPITRAVGLEELSEYQKGVLKLNKTKHNTKTRKLILDLHKKEKYLVHYRYLQGIVKLGYVCSKIHNVIAFKQTQWLKPYIDMNTKSRQEKGISSFQKDFFKLLNNAIYGKTNENVLNRNNFELVKNTKLAIKKMSKENFKCGTMINDLYFIESQKQSVKYNRPNYIGNAILDLSKLYMFEFHHNYMKQKYGDKCELVYTDTDSFVYLVETDDLFQDCFDNRELFDLTDVIIDKFKDGKNSKVIGMFKDETNFKPIVSFCALAPKSYSFITDDGINKKTCKGVSKLVLKKEISNEDYENTLKTGKELSRENVTIRSFKHQLFTVKQTKKCLSAFDSKMYRDSYNEGTPFGYVKC